MKKLNFFSVLLLAGVIVAQPLVSCTAKDYDADINRINKEIADVKTSISTLDQAIKAGKLITKVAEVAGGWEITFSDNSKITVKHGANGTDGKNGIDGINGSNGKDGFAPILGIDAAGYWTVISTSGGAPVRMKDTNGQDVKAVASVPSIGENGNWFIDGIDTGKPARGEQGDKGDQGEQGDKGDQGEQGEQGDKGDQGEQGEQGDKGDKGDQGEQGEQGEQGDKGDQGEQGEQGDKGDQGIAGIPGSDGAPGKSPYINELNHNWMVWNAQSGKYEDSGISAKVIANISVDETTGELKIDGKPTNRFVPPVVFDALNNKVFVTLKDDDGKPFKYEIALMKDVLTQSSIVSLMVEKMYVPIKYGIVSNISDPAVKAKRDAFIGKTTGAVLYSGVEAGFIVNPTNAELRDGIDKMSLITPKGEELLSLEQKWSPFNYTDGFVNTRAGSNSTALWTAKIVEPTTAQLASLSKNIAMPMAVKVTTGSGKSERSVVSNYGYGVRSLEMSSFNTIANITSINDATIGKTIDATAIYAGTAAPSGGKSNNEMINPYNYYKAELVYDNSNETYKAANDAVKSFITINGMSFSTNMTNAAALENKIAYFTVRMVDYTGAYYELSSYHKFSFNLSVEASAEVNHTLALLGALDPATKLYDNQKLVSMATLFGKLTPYGMSNKNLSSNLEIKNLPVGVVLDFVKADASVVVQIYDADCKSLRFTINEAEAVPGTYNIEMVATGANVSGSGTVTATQKVTLVIVNPSVSTYSIASKRTALFVGNLLTVYGDFAPSKAYAQVSDPTIYTILTGAYNGVTPLAGYQFKAVGMSTEDEAKYGVPFVGATNNGGKFNVTGKNVGKYTYGIKITTPLFGNTNNMVVADEIRVLAQSEVVMGTLFQQSGKSINLTNGQDQTAKLSQVFGAKDVYGKDLSLFAAAQNERIADSDVKVSGANASLVTVARDGNDWTISTVSGSARLESDVQIPLEITITDKLGAKKTLSTSFTLKKNI